VSVPQLDLIGIVVDDMARSLAFYRQLGLDVPAEADTQPHVEITLAGGVRVAWDTLETVQSFDPDFKKPEGLASAWRSYSTRRPTSTPPTTGWSRPATTATRPRGMRSGASGTL
jgi:hypothetical protein